MKSQHRHLPRHGGGDEGTALFAKEGDGFLDIEKEAFEVGFLLEKEICDLPLFFDWRENHAVVPEFLRWEMADGVRI